MVRIVDFYRKRMQQRKVPTGFMATVQPVKNGMIVRLKVTKVSKMVILFQWV